MATTFYLACGCLIGRDGEPIKLCATGQQLKTKALGEQVCAEQGKQNTLHDQRERWQLAYLRHIKTHWT